MITRKVKGVNISALSLGTVQLGLNYGIANQAGKPDESASFDILSCALNSGVTALDTAIAYGNSEEVIGKWLKGVPEEKRPFVMTKVKHLDHSSLSALRKDVREQVALSKSRLGLDQLPLLMLHSCDEYDCDKENVTTVFNELKESGDIRFSGISAYSYHNYFDIAASGFDAVQIPLNIFDWTQIESGGLKALNDAGMMVYVRSVYLQGLVFRDPDTLPEKMAFCREPLRKFHEFCREFNMSPAVLSMSYALSLPGVTSLVLGSENVQQVKENVALVESAPRLIVSQLQKVREAFINIDPRVVNPSAWQ